MILSVSRRTDIPSFYLEWFMNRLKEGFVLVRNPVNYHQVSRIPLSPSLIDCIVFWTKNADPLLPYIAQIRKQYALYFQYTINAYGKDIEPCLPALANKINSFNALSDQIGHQAVIWRYDPILLTEKYSTDWHIDRFHHIAKSLHGKTDTCVFGFIDIYDKIKNQIKSQNITACSEKEMDTLASAFSQIAARYNISLRTCAETLHLEKYGIAHGCCIDGELISRLTGWTMKAKKDPNQRAECGCMEIVDIGQYNTCRHGCRYCYANLSPQSDFAFSSRHNPRSPFLIGGAEASDRFVDRKMKSLKDENVRLEQVSMF